MPTYDTITTSDQLVRLRIYEGVIPATEGMQELLDMEIKQHCETRRRLLKAEKKIRDLENPTLEVRRPDDTELAELFAEHSAVRFSGYVSGKYVIKDGYVVAPFFKPSPDGRHGCRVASVRLATLRQCKDEEAVADLALKMWISHNRDRME